MHTESPEILSRKVIERAPMSMAIVGMDGTIEYINQKAVETFGYLHADIPTMARWWEQAYPDAQYRAQVVARWMGLVAPAVAEGHEIPRSDYQVTCKDGTVKTVGIFGVPVAGKVFVMFDDITERKQTEQRLRESEANFRAVLEGSLDVAYRRDLKRDEYDYLSPSIETISGYTVAEFSRMSFATVQEHFHPDDRQPVQTRVQRSLAGEPIHGTIEYRFRHKDGTYRWFADSGKVITDAAGAPLYHVGIVRDVTELKQLENASRANERRLTALLNASTEPIMLLDPEGLILTLNQAMSHRIGKPPAELLGAFAPGLLDATLGRSRQAHLNTVVRSGQALRFEDEKGGHYFDNNLYPVVEENGRVVAVAVFSSDITARKLAELKLQQANAALESKVQERTEQIRALASEVTLAEQRERKRIAGILHDDLQQLLIAARFNLNGLSQIKQQQTQHVVAQVEGLLAQAVKRSRLLSVELSPPILQIGGLVPALEWLASWMETNHGLSVSFAVHGRGTPQQEDVAALLFQVTRELLLNVVKHAQVKTATIEIAQDKGMFRIIVADRGVGFDPTHLAKRAANSTSFGLLGIRDRLDLLGGRMEIESVVGKGSRFSLHAPRTLAKAATPKALAVRKEKKGPGTAKPRRAGQVRTGAARKIRVLIVDDHNLVRQAFAQLLNGTGDIQAVGEAASGEAALALLEQLPVDIVTMDINMKGMDGMEATRRIRAQFPQIRVLGLSMFEEEERANAMRAAGACDYLSKSSPAAQLIAAIRRAAHPPAAGC
jgi:PAS domain S-box-containing protein